jgi:hypothetical protein
MARAKDAAHFALDVIALERVKGTAEHCDGMSGGSKI